MDENEAHEVSSTIKSNVDKDINESISGAEAKEYLDKQDYMTKSQKRMLFLQMCPKNKKE